MINIIKKIDEMKKIMPAKDAYKEAGIEVHLIANGVGINIPGVCYTKLYGGETKYKIGRAYWESLKYETQFYEELYTEFLDKIETLLLLVRGESAADSKTSFERIAVLFFEEGRS